MDRSDSTKLIWVIKDLVKGFEKLNLILKENNKQLDGIRRILQETSDSTKNPEILDVLGDNIPINFDWDVDPIVGTGQLLKLDDGTVSLEILISPQDSEHLQFLLETMRVKAFSISVVDNVDPE